MSNLYLCQWGELARDPSGRSVMLPAGLIRSDAATFADNEDMAYVQLEPETRYITWTADADHNIDIGVAPDTTDTGHTGYVVWAKQTAMRQVTGGQNLTVRAIAAPAE